MALAEQFVLNVAVVEVQYRKGVVYLDRCGSVMLRLEEALGPAFEGDVPQMQYAELTNAAERIALRYGPKSFSVAQHWVRSPVRVEAVAPIAWDHISESLGVAREVTRCGVRFAVMWGVESVDEAERRIAAARLFSEAPEWVETFGAPKTRTWTTTSESREGQLTASLTGMHTEIKGVLAADLVAVVPPHSVVLQLDYTTPGEPPFSLHKGQMKDFIRSSWERAKRAATVVRARLAAGDV